MCVQRNFHHTGSPKPLGNRENILHGWDICRQLAWMVNPITDMIVQSSVIWLPAIVSSPVIFGYGYVNGHIGAIR